MRKDGGMHDSMTSRMTAALALVLWCPGLVFAAPPRADLVTLGFGTGPAEVGVATPASHPEAHGMPLPMGPSAFRSHRDGFLVLDGVNRRILAVGGDGRVRGARAVPGAEGGASPSGLAWLGDLAVVPSGAGSKPECWVLDRLDASVVRIDGEGKELARVGGVDRDDTPFLDPVRLEVDAAGRLHVEDAGREAILVFAPDGRLLSNRAATGRGLHLAADGTATRLEWDAGTGQTRLFATDPEGRERSPQSLEGRFEVPPTLQGRLASGAWLVTVPVEGDAPGRVRHQLVRFGPEGRREAVLDLEVPEGMVRFLVPGPGDAVTVADGDLLGGETGRWRLRRIEAGAEPTG